MFDRKFSLDAGLTSVLGLGQKHSSTVQHPRAPLVLLVVNLWQDSYVKWRIYGVGQAKEWGLMDHIISPNQS